MQGDVTWEDVETFLAEHGVFKSEVVERFLELEADIQEKVSGLRRALEAEEKGTEAWTKAESNYKKMVTIFNDANRIKELPYEQRVVRAKSWVEKLDQLAGKA
mmetsp:Transcript_22199/g.87439  ORF Transcript_22199/g.87439 Transcript_22199/m.87439 type:complete len:103 (-) Transcript_22199:1982-2290(-)